VPVSAYFAAISLAIVITAVVAVALIASEVRYGFILRSAAEVERTYEGLDVGVATSGTQVLLMITGYGSRAVTVKQVVLQVAYTAVLSIGGQTSPSRESVVQVFPGIFTLRPGDTKFFFYDVGRSRHGFTVTSVVFSRIAVVVETAMATYVFDPAPSLSVPFAVITNDTVGKTLQLSSPYGTFRFSVYEYAACFVGPGSRLYGAAQVDSSYVFFYPSASGGVGEVQYNYGLDRVQRGYAAPTVPNFNIQVRRYNMSCNINMQGLRIDQGGLYAGVTRGVVLVGDGTPLLIPVRVVFSGGEWSPDLVKNAQGVTAMKNYTYAIAVAAPKSPQEGGYPSGPFNYVSAQIGCPSSAGPSQRAVGIEAFYSQYLFVGQSLCGLYTGGNIHIMADTPEPYPIIIIFNIFKS